MSCSRLFIFFVFFIRSYCTPLYTEGKKKRLHLIFMSETMRCIQNKYNTQEFLMFWLYYIRLGIFWRVIGKPDTQDKHKKSSTHRSVLLPMLLVISQGNHLLFGFCDDYFLLRFPGFTRKYFNEWLPISQELFHFFLPLKLIIPAIRRQAAVSCRCIAGVINFRKNVNICSWLSGYSKYFGQ